MLQEWDIGPKIGTRTKYIIPILVQPIQNFIRGRINEGIRSTMGHKSSNYLSFWSEDERNLSVTDKNIISQSIT